MFRSGSNKYCVLVGLSLPVMLPLALAINRLPGLYGRISFTIYSVLMVYFFALFIRNTEFCPVEFAYHQIERVHSILKTHFSDIVFRSGSDDTQDREAQRIYETAMGDLLSFAYEQSLKESRMLRGVHSIQDIVRLSAGSICALLVFIAFPARRFMFYSTNTALWLLVTAVCCVVAFVFGSSLKPKAFNLYKRGYLAEFFISHLADYYKYDCKKPSDKRLSYRCFGSEINHFVYKSREELTPIEAAQLVHLTRNIVKSSGALGGLYDEFNEILYFIPLFATISIAAAVVLNFLL